MGSDIEIAFRLSFRVAAILGASDSERALIFKDVKGFYDTRSKVVHGGYLGSKASERRKHEDRMKDYARLRDYVRQLMLGFMNLALKSNHEFNSEYFRSQIDADMQDKRRLRLLRGMMGLPSAGFGR